MPKKQTGKQQADTLAKAVGEPSERKAPTQGHRSTLKPSKRVLQPDRLPKVGEGKSYKEITAVSVILLPKNTVKPVNGRIFCKMTAPEERVTKSGLILADGPLEGEQDSNAYLNKDKVQKDRKRFWVIDFADDIPFKLERGDEVYPFWIDESLGYNPQMIRDFGNNGMDYFVFHFTEIAGVSILEHEKKEE